MRKLDFNDIQMFYDCYEKEIHQSTIANLTEEKIDEICNKTIERIEGIRIGSKSVVNNMKGHMAESKNIAEILTLLLNQNCLTHFLEIAESREKLECGNLKYDGGNTEYQMWAWAVFFMSWTLRNLKGKVEVGHCRNPNHKHRSDINDNMNCPHGSKFHLDFYNDCLKSFKDIIHSAENNPPILIKE